MPPVEELNNKFRTILPRMADTLREREQHLSGKELVQHSTFSFATFIILNYRAHFAGLNEKLQELQCQLEDSEESLNFEKQNLNGKVQSLMAYSARLVIENF